MSSRLRGSAKDNSDVAVRRDHFREDLKSYKNGTNRYHFGMTRQNDEAKNGRDHKDRSPDDADQLYKKSREHFGVWDIKDIIVQDDRLGSRKQPDRFEDSRLTNGQSRNDSPKHDRREDDRGRTGSVDRDQSHRSRRKDTWEGSDAKVSSKSHRKNDPQPIDERDLLLREIESLAVDGRSPDRRIRAMIERFKCREEKKMKSKRERDSLSPEKDEYRSKSMSRGDTLVDRDDCGREFGSQKEDRRENRRTARSRVREGDRNDLEDGRSRSVDRRLDKSNELIGEKNEDSRKSDETRGLRHKSDLYGLEKSHRRSRDMEDDPPRRKDSPKRRSYTYEGNPEDFDIRIQRYERALLEPRRDLDSPRRASSKDSAGDLNRKESFKDQDRQVTRKSSFKSGDAKKSRESSLNRKTSLKENDVHRKNSFKNQDTEKYFRKNQEHVSRRGSFKEQGFESARKNSLKDQSSDYGRISTRNCENEEERKNAKGHGVSRITFKEQDEGQRVHSLKEQDEGQRVHSLKEQEAEAGRVGFKHRDVAKKNSFKEKTVEFAGISYKDHDEEEDPSQRISYKNDSNEPGMVVFRSLDDSRQKTSANGRYVEFLPASYQMEGEVLNEVVLDHDRRSPSKDRDSSAKRRASLRSKSHDSFDRKSERHSKPLSPPKRDDCRENCKDREDFDSNSWHESNRLFAATYLRENSKYRSNPEGHSEIERDPSPEMGSYLEIREKSPGEVLNDEKQRNEYSTVYALADADQSKDLDGRVSSTRERNGATIIRIRSSPETTVERRRRRRPAQELYAGRRRRFEDEEDSEDEAEEDDDEDPRRPSRPRDPFPPGRGVTTPSRRIWNYREGGVLITDVEEGQPCLQCGETCSGFSPHTWRKNCTSCKCPREAHDVCHEEWVSVRSRLGLKGEESTSPVGFDPRAKGLAWAPPGLPAHKVDEYFAMLPELSVPRLGTPGERYRDRQLAIQLPKQDLARTYCRHLNPKHASSADDFMAARNEIALDIGNVQEVLERDLHCGVCLSPLKYGSLAVSTSKLGLLYHPACFRCTDCKELLVDLAYCVHDDTLFCERHYAEQLKPRCAACDELIFSGEYTKAMNKDWHSGHFCCWQCDESLTGQRYVLRDEHPYCIKCYESVFANSCEECNKIIGIDSKDLSYKDKHWHEACFLCNRCRVSLVDKQFGSKVDKIYCGNCYDAQFASRCDGCGEIFRAGTKKMEYKTRQWHEKCFCCVVCKNPIGTKSFIPREQEIYCAGCYEDKFATRCVKCNKIITSGGVTYKNEPWHRDCFTCSNCNNSLAGQRFTSRDDKPYCADCFGELFAKKCTACSKPITGIGGTRFISFEDRHWHNDCFICAGCKTSLVGRGFITDNEDIICPECAKMKLM